MRFCTLGTQGSQCGSGGTDSSGLDFLVDLRVGRPQTGKYQGGNQPGKGVASVGDTPALSSRRAPLLHFPFISDPSLVLLAAAHTQVIGGVGHARILINSSCLLIVPVFLTSINHTIYRYCFHFSCSSIFLKT